MPIGSTVTVTEVVQLTDGNWNRQPTFEPVADNVKVTETIILAEPVGGWSSIDLSIVGDFNDPKEILWVEITDDNGTETATLFDNDYSNDVWFWGEATGPTNGVANPWQGAQPSQGNIFINGVQPTVNGPWVFTEDDIDSILANEAVFTLDSDRVEITGDVSGLEGDLTVKFTIQEFDNAAQQGVDFAEIVLTYEQYDEWMSDMAISNVVFYLDCGDDELIKVKIDDWDELGIEFMSTENLDFTELGIQDFLFEECGLTDCELVGMTIKAGNNREEGFFPNEANGEGEIVFGDEEIIGDYGKLNDFDCVVQAGDVFPDYFLIV